MPDAETSVQFDLCHAPRSTVNIQIVGGSDEKIGHKSDSSFLPRDKNEVIHEQRAEFDDENDDDVFTTQTMRRQGSSICLAPSRAHHALNKTHSARLSRRHLHKYQMSLDETAHTHNNDFLDIVSSNGQCVGFCEIFK